MSAIPSSLARVPNILASQLQLASITRTSIDILRVQEQLASGRRVGRPSDDSVAATAISLLDDRLERIDQRLRNLSAAQTTLDSLDSSLGEVSDLLLEAQSIASSQIGVNSDAQTRSTQSIVIASMLEQLMQVANRSANGVHYFGGSTTNAPPVQALMGGFRYVGRGSGLHTDINLGGLVPVSVGGDTAIGATSARLAAGADLTPDLTADTRISDLGGTRGVGVSLGVISFSFDGGPDAEVDLTGADTVGDVLDRVAAAIGQYESDNGVTILGPGGVSVAGGAISFDVVGGPPDPELVFSDPAQGVTAGDLGLSQTAFSAGSPDGEGVSPRLTLLTPIDALPGVTTPMDGIIIRFSRAGSSQTRQIDLSGAQTVGDIKSLIETQAPGVRVRINAAGSGIELVSEVAGPAMTVEEVSGGAATATELGIRSLSAATLPADFNSGRGVRIVTDQADPVTGLPDPARNIDFTVTLGNGDTFGVDLRPEDLASVQTLLDRINAQAAQAAADGDIPAGAFVAELTDGPNGITFRDAAGLGQIRVEASNNSGAASDLGLLDGAWDASSASLIAQDRAGVRVDNLFTALIELHDALLADDSTGITIAGEKLQRETNRLAQTRALVGVYARRVSDGMERQEGLRVLDERTRSELRDVDFAEAATRFSLLQTQLEAGLAGAARAQSLSLLDFLR